jgi:hypothetical protein
MVKIIRERRVESGYSYDLCFDWIINGQQTDGGFSFQCDEHGNVDMQRLQSPDHEAGLENYRLCQSGLMRDRQGNTVSPGYVRRDHWSYVVPAAARCDSCAGEAEMNPYCGAWVCHQCGNHLGMARCYCGWAISGGDGQHELVEMGETIDPD